MNSKDVLNNYNSLIDAMKGKILTNINIDDLYKIGKKELKDNRQYEISSYSPKIKDMNKLAECYSIGDWGYVLLGDEDSVKEISFKLKEVLSN
jgi:anionic cell wall polymer biosynthesis LytR-Cps2A-Psr (LCP) family protein